MALIDKELSFSNIVHGKHVSRAFNPTSEIAMMTLCLYAWELSIVSLFKFLTVLTLLLDKATKFIHVRWKQYVQRFTFLTE